MLDGYRSPQLMREQSKGSFLDRISEAAWRHANETAIEFGSHGVSYAELDRRSNAVAAAIAAMSLSHNSLIALMMRRSDEMLVGALGILKAGHAYIPIDPAFPEDRVAYMISHSDAQAIVVDAASAAPHGPGVYRTYSELEQEGRGLPLPVVVRNDDDLAYVIYTSGSTGTPKGVMVPVSSVCNFLDSMAVAPGLSQQDVLLAVTTFSFDIAVLELFLPLTVGARAVIADETCVDDGAKLADLMSQCNATVMQATPATWRMLLASDWQGKKDLKVLCGGEAAPPELMAELCACTAEVWNMYGPTETTIWSSCYRVPAGAQQIYLGPPIASTQLYVVDENGSEVGTSEPGELYIGGEGLATGYLKDETQTRERFVKAPQLCSDGLLYRTGDLVSRDAEGNIAFIGRLDNQVKIRGYRIELGEIESALRAHPDVAQAAVITANIDGDKCLVAYITSESGEPPALASLRTVVDSKLPYYMMPQYFVALPELPLTPNRKIDRKALPGIDDVVPISDAEFVAASTDVEKAIRDIWCDVLHLEDVGIHSDFFHIGGHSLTATRVWSRLKSRLGINLSLKTVFEISTISGLAKEVAEVRETDAADTGIPVISRMKRPEMSVAQQRFWYIDQLAGDLPLYNLCASFRFKGNLDQGALNNALNAIIARHEILRTQLVWEEGRPLQAIKPALKYALESDDLSALGEKEAYDELMAKMQTRIKRKVLLDQTPAFDACLYRLSSDDHVLFFMPHHVIWDGWSFDVFLSELKAFYEEEIGQKEADLPELPIQYADFAEWHRKQVEDETFSSQLEYWEEVLGNELPLLNLPTDYARPQQFGFEGRTKYVKFGAPVIVAVGELARQNRTTVNVVVLALYYGLLHRYTGQDDIIIGSPIQGRLAEETENLIGLFVNTVPIRVSLAGNPTINELVCRVRDTALEAYQKQ
jgi:amino acid adenylation domain-containing protein